MMKKLQTKENNGTDYKCRGGPYNGKRIFLEGKATMRFSVGKIWQGSYIPAKTNSDVLIWKDHTDDT